MVFLTLDQRYLSTLVLDSSPFIEILNLVLFLQVLEIRGDKARVIRSNRDRLHELQVADYI